MATAFEPVGSTLTLISFVLDRTGSMNKCKIATISGFNEYIETQQNTPGECIVSFTVFDSDRGVETLHECRSVHEIPLLTDDTYVCRGGTNLYDAIGTTIDRTMEQVARMDTPPSVLLVIMTDGDNNASREYDRAAIVARIREMEQRGWTFVYLGANQDAWAVGQGLGFSVGNTKSYDVGDTRRVMRGLAASTASYRSAGSMQTKNFFDGGEPLMHTTFQVDAQDVIDPPKKKDAFAEALKVAMQQKGSIDNAS